MWLPYLFYIEIEIAGIALSQIRNFYVYVVGGGASTIPKQPVMGQGELQPERMEKCKNQSDEF
jgi:hypothetical protein